MKIGVSHVRMLITGLNTERFLNMLIQDGIKLYSVKFCDKGIYVKLSVDDYKKIRKAVRITGVHTVIVKRYGIRFRIFEYRKRYFFVIGGLLFIILNIFLTGRIYKIKIEGNVFYSDEEIYEYIQNEGVDYGHRADDIDCTLLEQGIRNNFENISWVSVNISGSSLKINVRENKGVIIDSKGDAPCDIIAEKDGQITEMIVRAGTPMVKVGDMVTKGTVLVSSKVDYNGIYGDSFGGRYVTADADIMIKVSDTYNKVTNRKYEVREYTGRTMTVNGVKLMDYYMIFNSEKCKYERYDTETFYDNIK